jgi:hypothetical protein
MPVRDVKLDSWLFDTRHHVLSELRRRRPNAGAVAFVEPTPHVPPQREWLTRPAWKDAWCAVPHALRFRQCGTRAYRFSRVIHWTLVMVGLSTVIPWTLVMGNLDFGDESLDFGDANRPESRLSTGLW